MEQRQPFPNSGGQLTGKELKDKLYLRAGRGWYADLRSLGGKREAMIPEGERHATTDWDTAYGIMKARAEELKRAPTTAPEDTPAPTLEAAAKRFLRGKARVRRRRTVERYEGALRKFVSEWGGEVKLNDIAPEMVEDYMDRRLSEAAVQTVLHELHALHGLYKMMMKRTARLPADDVRRVTFNPVAVLDLPELHRPESEYLEIGEAARLLKAAEALNATPHSRACPFVHPILATGLLSGGRLGAVLSLEVRDVDFEAGVVHYRPNGWYRLKGKPRYAERRVPLWPQLDAILADYIAQFGRVDDLADYPGGAFAL